MNTTTFKVGDEVVFGRPNGEQTRGRVKRVNRKSLSIEQTEARGAKRVRTAGTVWRVHPALVRHAGTAAPTPAARKPAPAAPTATTFKVGDRVAWDHGGRTVTGTVKRVNRKTVSTVADGDPDSRWWRVPPRLLRAATGTAPAPKAKRPDSEILSDLAAVESRLSPENLSWDGERSIASQRAAARRLNAEKRRLLAELGRKPTFAEVWGA